MGDLLQGADEDQGQGEENVQSIKQGREGVQNCHLEYMKRIFRDEILPFSFSRTQLLGISKKKGSALDLR